MRTRKKNFKYYTSKKYDGMMGRCYRESDRSYKTYGGRGIRVSSEWIRDINAFRVWMYEELTRIGVSIQEFEENSAKYQLDRIDIDGHYTAKNCRIINPQGNTRNRRCTVLKTITSAEGEEIKIC